MGNKNNTDIKHTITINNISQANSSQDIVDSIKRFLKRAKDKQLDIKIITPTDFIAERLYKDFNDYIDNSKVNTFCFYSVKLDYLLSNTYKQQRKKWQSKLNITYINKADENPLEIFIDKISKQAKDEQYNFFGDIALLDYKNAYIPQKTTKNFNDIKDTDSIGIRFIKEFFIDLMDRVTNYYKTYIEDKKEQQTKLKDIKTKLMNARNEILKNLSNTEQNTIDDERRAALLVALKVGICIVGVCLSLGSGGVFIVLALSLGATSLIREIYDISKELNELENNRYYRVVAVPILTAFFKDISDVLAICFVESNIFMLLDSDGNFVDLAGLESKFFIQEKSFNITPKLNQIIQGKYHGNIQNIIDILTQKKPFTINDNNEYSSMCISPLNIDSNTTSPAYNLFSKLAKSYTNFVYITHPNFTSTMLSLAIKEKNITTQSSKNYITLTPPPNKEKAGSMQQAIKTLDIQIQGRPEPPKLQIQKPTQDYSGYIHDDMTLDNIFLYISPFVKINQTKKGEYKDNKLLSNDDREYIQSFMLQDENIESIKTLQKTFIKEHIEYYKFLFDSIKYEEYTSNDYFAFDKKKYVYTTENIFLKALLLYYLEEDGAEIKKGWFVKFYAKTSNIETTLQDNKTIFLLKDNKTQEINLIYLKNQIKEAINAYKNNENNDCEIKLTKNIILHPFSQDINKLSLAFISNSIKEQYINFSDNNLNKALPLIMQSIAENILTNLLPTTKVFFADTQSKTIEAISILFITFAFALYVAQKEGKFILSLLSVATNTNLAIIIKNATLETLQTAFNYKKDSIKISNNIKKNTQINNLLNQIDIKTLSKDNTIKLDRAGNKLIINKENNHIKLIIIDNNNKQIKQPTYITIQANNTQTKNTIAKTMGIEMAKQISFAVILSIADSIFTNIIKSLFKTDSKTLLEKYNILESKLHNIHNAPLLMDNNTFFTYPMAIDSRMIIYNFAYGLFGGNLSTGGLEISPNILLYAALQKRTMKGNITNQSAFTRQEIIKQILAFIIPDELRGGLQDKDFYENMLRMDISSGIELKQKYKLDYNNKQLQGKIDKIIESYKLNKKQCKKQDIIFNPQANQSTNIIVDSYNFCIDYLADMIDNKPKTTHTRKFVESIRNIAKNNILAIYEGVAETNKVGEPKIFGRIATTIIQKDGLYLG
ncbi:hypothetical protein [Helicobacter saguini]|uniref:Uncharacterized protein n=1 Tax=Helicobacter saguini TaxID=1548018 RepID=A0A6L7DDJ9_9HELI|nr:hypothetical protein [Helicobacter saguini]MWV69979.1 hypothetical protein [Helicobacter saguini]